MKQLNKRQIAGWIAVGLSIVITCFWAFWGIIENFHEGWYFESWLSNVGLMFVQYLSPMLIFMGVTLISIFWPRVGGSLHAISALLAIWFFEAFSNAATFLLIIPLAGMGVMYWFGRPRPRKIAASLFLRNTGGSDFHGHDRKRTQKLGRWHKKKRIPIGIIKNISGMIVDL